MVELDQVGKYYGSRMSMRFLRRHDGQWALRNVSLTIKQGEVFALLGANGSGKSTLIRIIASLLHHDEGTVKIGRFQLPNTSPKLKQMISRVSADAAFHKKLSGYENLIHTAYLYGLSRQEADERIAFLCDSFYFNPVILRDSMETLSRGMQQKVSILRAMLPRPALLLLDEPTTGLDPVSRKDLYSALNSLWHLENTTVLLTSHYMEEVSALSHRIGFLNKGTLVAAGTDKEILSLFLAQTLDEAFRAAMVL